MTIRLLFSDGRTWTDTNARHIRVNVNTGTIIIRGKHMEGGLDSVTCHGIDLGELISITVDDRNETAPRAQKGGENGISETEEAAQQ